MNKIRTYFKKTFIFLSFLILSLTLVSCKKWFKKEDNKSKPTQIVASISDENIFIGDSASIEVSVFPSTFSQEFEVSLSDKSIGSYANNQITGLKEGTLSITIYPKGYSDINTTVTLTVMPDLENEVFEANLIATAHGENASTQAMIKYQAYNKNTFVEYTLATDVEFLNATKVIGSCYYFCQLEEKLENPFSERYIYRTYLNNLTPDTTYIYRVNKGNDTYSDVYSFKTAKGSGDTTFVYLSDTHYWANSEGKSHGSELSEDIINNIVSDYPEVTLVVDGGDTVDKGGNSQIWEVMYSVRNTYKTLAYAGVPGNHEYYIKSTGQWDNRFFKAMTPSLLNGPDGETFGSSYYFVYNNVLFLMVDNATKAGYTEKLEWMEYVLKNVDYKYSVVTYHIPTNGENTDYDPKINAILQKYAVDLVLSGHYHSESFSSLFDNSNVVQELGNVKFFRATSSGVKGSNPRAYAITISSDGHILIEQYSQTGKEKTNYEYDSIKYQTPVGGEVNFIMTKDEDNNSINISWGEGAYGTYKSIVINEEYRNLYSKEIIVYSTDYDNITIHLDRKGYDSLFKVVATKLNNEEETFYFKIDDTTASFSISSITSSSAKLSFTKAESTMFNYLIDHYDIYINNELVASMPYTQTIYNLKNLTPNTKYVVECKAIDYNDTIAYILTNEFTTTE